MTRDTWLVGGALVAALLIGVGFYFFDFEKVLAPIFPHQASSVEVLATGTTSQVTERKNYKIVTAEQLAEVWGMAYGDHAPAIPTVDFSKNEVLALFAGTKPSGGYGIGVKSLMDTMSERQLGIVFTEPGKDCITTQALTSPFVFVEVSLSDLPIQKNETTEVGNCQ